MTDATPPTRLRAYAGAALFALAVAAAAAGGLALLHARADDVAAQPPAPAPVRLLALTLQDGHDVGVSYAGRVEPARETLAAFERGGLVAAVLVREGDAVAAGEPLARLDTALAEAERARLRAAVAQAEADLALAESTLRRRSAIADRGFETGQALDEARFAQAAREAALDAARAAEASVALDIEKATLRAPFDGVVARRMIDEGAVIDAGVGVVRLQEAGRPRARIGAPPAAAARLTPGAAVTVTARGGPVSGVVASAAPDVDPATRTVSVMVDLDPASPVAMGDVVRLTLSQRVDGRGAWVPLSALGEGPRGLWALWLATEEGGALVARRTAVEALHVAGDRAFVRGALSDGQQIVAEGVERLTEGRALAATAPAS